jgi:hypothetical protein
LPIDTQHSVKYRASHPVNSGFWDARKAKKTTKGDTIL